MSQAPHVPQEVIGFRRSPALPGIEVVDADNSPREWRVACPTFAVVVFRTWSGPVRVGGSTLHGKPGVAFCNVPDELMVSRPDGDRPGSFNVIEIQREVLREWLAEQSGGTLPLQWAELMRPISPNLFGRFQRFFGAFAGGGSPLELQSELLELSEGMISDLIAGASPRPFQAGPPLRGTARMRECLTEEGFDLDLETLARKVGLSRFQALRAFKRRYGLPPHAYQLCVRLDQARRLLIDGAAPVDVALRCGFVDQSHFNRHFKRAFGITPAHYARGEGARRASGVYLASRPLTANPAAVMARSDRRR